MLGASCLGLFAFDTSQDVLESWEIGGKWVLERLHDVVEPDTRKVAFDCLVFEVLLPKESDELAKSVFVGWVRSDMVLGAEC